MLGVPAWSCARGVRFRPGYAAFQRHTSRRAADGVHANRSQGAMIMTATGRSIDGTLGQEIDVNRLHIMTTSGLRAPLGHQAPEGKRRG